MCFAACEFRCSAGVVKRATKFDLKPDCIKQDEVCDGVAFCVRGQDEKGCGKCMDSYSQAYNMYVL